MSEAEDQFLNELSRSPYEAPPITGELLVSFTVPLVSLQSKKGARDAFEATVKAETSRFRYLFSGDLSLEVTIEVHQQDRYESDTSPDLDNFLKPLLDALSGLDGLLIDDCQIRTLTISWISWIRDDSRLNLRFGFIDTEYVEKKGLIFVQMQGPLCLPFPGNAPLMGQRLYLVALENQFRVRSRLERLGADYYVATSILSAQRRFHRTRLKGFLVKTVEEFRRDLSALRRGSGSR